MDKHSSWGVPKRKRAYSGFVLISSGFGVFFGVLAGHLLDAARFQTLYQYLAEYFQTDLPQSSAQMVYQSLFQANSLDIIKLLFLGFCLIGAPLILLQLFIKGFSLGFTLSLFLKGLAVKQALAGLSILVLAQMVPVALILAAGVYALQSSWALFLGQGYNWLRYLLCGVFLILAVLAASCLEGFLLHSVFTEYLTQLFA